MAERSDKRDAEKRARKRLLVRFMAETDREQRTRTAFTGNLSEHGMLLKTQHIHRPGTLLAVEVETPEGTYMLAGRVVWAKRVPPRLAQISSSSMGIYFRSPGPEWAEFCKAWKNTEAEG